METSRESLARRSPSLERVQLPARRRLFGGAQGNASLTSLAGALLVVLLAVEGSTIPFLGALLSVHVFVGMLLLGPVALKLGTTGYRFARYYLQEPEYVRFGPPIPLMRFIVAPILVVSTLSLFGTGVALLAVPHRGTVLALHQASFLVWVGATAIHVLAYARRALRHLIEDAFVSRVGGERWRLVALVLAVAAGLAVGVATYPLAAPWLHGGAR
jgi:hypothetical protein